MNNTKLLAVVIAFYGVVACSTGQAAIDGSLADWGIAVGTNGHLTYNTEYGYSYTGSKAAPNVRGSKVVLGRTVAYNLEDSDDHSNNYQVGPLFGGQDYDAEALVASIVDGDLYIAIATGQRPDNGFSCFAPGDICITQGATTWGIEVGGGAGTWSILNGFGGSSASSSIVGGATGTTYTLSSSGDTVWMDRRSQQTRKAGSIWKGGTWTNGISGSGIVNTQLVSGGTFLAQLGKTDYVYNFDGSFGEHAFIEACVPDYQTVFRDALVGATISWAPVCGNDTLCLSVTLPPVGGDSPVPEPASAAIWVVLTLAMVWFGRKNLRSSDGRLSH